MDCGERGIWWRSSVAGGGGSGDGLRCELCLEFAVLIADSCVV